MAENKMKEVAKILGVEMGVPFNIRDKKGHRLSYSPYTLKNNGVYDKDNEFRSGLLHLLINGTYEIEQPILDEVEKRYLEGVLRPFKGRVKYIKKCHTFTLTQELERIHIALSSATDCACYEYIPMPFFDKGTMYKGMEVDKKYTLEELGLFQDEKKEVKEDAKNNQ